MANYLIILPFPAKDLFTCSHQVFFRDLYLTSVRVYVTLCVRATVSVGNAGVTVSTAGAGDSRNDGCSQQNDANE